MLTANRTFVFLMLFGLVLSGAASAGDPLPLPPCVADSSGVLETAYRDAPMNQNLKIHLNPSAQKVVIWSESGRNGNYEFDFKTMTIRVYTYATYWSKPSLYGAWKCSTAPQQCLDVLNGKRSGTDGGESWTGTLAELEAAQSTMTKPEKAQEKAKRHVACTATALQSFAEKVRSEYLQKRTIETASGDPAGDKTRLEEARDAKDVEIELTEVTVKPLPKPATAKPGK